MPPNNLPLQLTSFIGRERELSEVSALLSVARLVTLSGTGGCGKTRLALQAAGDISQDPAAAQLYPDGIWLVEFAALNDAALLPERIAAALRIQEQPGQPMQAVLIEYLRARRLLLVLDNCEHLIGACAQLAQALLEACRTLQILATSRESLNVVGERLYRVPSLRVPKTDQPAGASSLATVEAVRLFVDRAMHIYTRFELTDSNAGAVAQICRELDGIPLAIELAAGRLPALSVEQIAERLHDRFGLLKGGSRAALLRQQTLRAAVDWSYDLLSEPERVLLRRLSVFAGGWTLEAAEEITKDEGGGMKDEVIPPSAFRLHPSDVLDLLTQLVHKSLVQMVVEGGGARYGLLETLRQYGREKLAESDEAMSLRTYHLEFFVRFVAKAEPHLQGAAQLFWVNQLETEFHNVQAAIDWSLQIGRADLSLRLVGALHSYWFTRGYYNEGRERQQAILARPEAAGQSIERAKVLNSTGLLAWSQNDYEAARLLLEESLSIAKGLGDKRNAGFALHYLGRIALNHRDYDVACLLEEECLALGVELEDKLLSGVACMYLGETAILQGKQSEAQKWYEKGAPLLRAAHSRMPMVTIQRRLGQIAQQKGNLSEAVTLYRDSLDMSIEVGNQADITVSIAVLATVAVAQKKMAHAAKLFGAVAALREPVKVQMHIFDREQFAQNIDVVCAQLETSAFEAAWSAGRALTLQQAICLARENNSVVKAVSPGQSQNETAMREDERARDPSEQVSVEPHLLLRKSGQTYQPPGSDVHVSPLRILTLGAGQILRTGHLLASAEWTYNKPRELLFLLFFHPPQTKEQVGLALWPDASPAQLRSNFRVALHALRRALGRPDWIVYEDEHYGFNRALGHRCDVEEFEAALEDARQALAVSDTTRAVELLTQASELYQGDFLADLDKNSWVLVRRKELRRQHLEALLTLGRLLFDAERHPKAAEAYRKVLAQDNNHEEAHRGLMRCLARSGGRAQAIGHYQELKARLRAELGVEPAEETTALYDRLKRGKSP